jgi:hypothetical protein
MHQDEKPLDGTAISVGDGSLGGAAIGGSVTGPDAGVIHDPVGRDIGVPIETTPDDPDTIDGEAAGDDLGLRNAALERSDPNEGRGTAS